MPNLRSVLILALLAACATPAVCAKAKPGAKAEAHPGEREFAAEVARAAQSKGRALSADQVLAVLDKAQYQQSIIDSISKPAESKTWKEYRPIFLNDKRINDGIAFARANAEPLQKVAQATGVPAEIIVAILGVETSYGVNTGRYKVIDALSTLAFHYPPRAAFFRGELKQLFLLPPEHLPAALESLTGSYAGAMGQGQFMPTSFAQWAVDGDGDARIDLWASKADVFASVANYFVAHGWQSGAPIAFAATRQENARSISPASLEPVYPIAQLAEWGYPATVSGVDPQCPATLVTLEGAEGTEYWLTTQNFFVISRYNRSPLYSMAVNQLAAAIAAGMGEPKS